MTAVELITDPDCPHVEAARTQLRRALAALDLPAEWQEWDRARPDAPAHALRYGSPTVLVNGRDVAGDGTEADANCCRVYPSADGGVQGTPSVEAITAALLRD